MRPSIKTLLIVFSILLSFSGFAQSPHEKSLLWRISGKGLDKPSYLFGTIHLTDERLFNFEDSVYNAIEKSDGLAIEVNPDEMIAEMLNKSIDDGIHERKIKDVLGENDYRHYAHLLKKRFGKSADEITVQDIVREKNKWMDEYLKKGEMPTFMDGYLYSIAKKQGKWLGGIEDITDQSNLDNELFDESDIAYVLADGNKTTHASISNENAKGLDKMIRLYNSQDLEGIEAFSNLGMVEQKKDILLINRNIKMARRMDSLAHLRTMFLAVGAAHLPGDSGVIALLRQRGFTVEPVFGTRRIAAKKFKFKEIPIPWTMVQDSSRLYKVSMPGPPITITPMGLLEMKFYFDVSNFTGLYSMAFNGPQRFSDSDSSYKLLAGKMLNTTKKLTGKAIKVDNIDGQEFFSTANGYPARLRIFLHGHTTYILMASSMKDEKQGDTTVQRFFDSFQPSIVDSVKSTGETSVFSDSILGIQFRSPVALSINKSLGDTSSINGWKVTTWNGIDATTGTLVMLLDKEVKPGQNIVSDNIIYEDFHNLLQKQYNNPNIEETIVYGRKAYSASGHSNIENFYMRSIATVYNGKAIFLFLMGDSALISGPRFTEIIHSIEFIKHPFIKWQTQSPPSESYSIWVPSPLSRYGENNSSGSQFIAFDTTTATTYSIIADTLNRFVWGKSDTSFLRKYTAQDFKNDSILSIKNLQNGSMGGVEYLVKLKNTSNVYKRLAYWLNGHQLFQLTTYGDINTIQNDNINKFFSSFQVKNIASDLISLGKPEDLFDNLSSSDSSVRTDAKYALYQMPFGQEDLFLLHNALFKKYPSSDSVYSDNSTNWNIVQKLSDMGDSSSVVFLKEKYGSLEKTDTTGRELVITTLSRMKTLYSFQTIASLLEQSPLLEAPRYMLASLRDTLSLTSQIFEQLLPLSKDSIMIPLLADLSIRLVDSGFVQMEQILPFKSNFESIAIKFQPETKKLKTNEVDYDWYQLVDLLGRWNSTNDVNILNSYLSTTDVNFLNYVVRKLLDSKHGVPATTLRSLAQNKVSRNGLRNNLKELKRMDLYPKEYLNRQSFAQADLYDIASEDGDGYDLPKVVFLEKRLTSYHGKKYDFYLFKISFKEEDDTMSNYLGVAGGYKPTSTKLDPEKLITNIYWKTQLDKTNKSELFDAFLDDLDSVNDED